MLAPMPDKTALIGDIERRALEIARAIDDRSGEYYAEYVEGITPLWHLVNVQPGEELRAMHHLADRRFGVFSPRFAEGAVMPVRTYDGNGKLQRVEQIKVGGKLIFPGRLFVFVWDVKAHWRRIRACTGVSRIMVDGDEKPVVITREVIDAIRILEFTLQPSPKPKRKRYRATEAERLTISTRSFWNSDDSARTMALDTTLNAV